jgi:hypothetical protein
LWFTFFLLSRRAPTVADVLTIDSGKVVLTTEEGQRFERPEERLLAMLRAELVPPLNGTALPDGVKFCEWRAPFLIVVHQLPPHVRQLRWIANDSPAPYGESATYRKVRLSVPYSITFAVYQQHGEELFLGASNELYFRNEPLRSRGDRLGYPALLNVSKIVMPLRERAWICTQYLDCPEGADWAGQLQALLEHTWNGGFNLSSEDHEGASWYGESQGIHPDLHPVERWEEATAADEAFALGVPWKEVPLNVEEVVEALFLENQATLSAQAGGGPRQQPGLASRFLNFAQKG